MASTLVCKTYNHFENITDPRVDRGTNYPLTEMIFLTLCACISDAQGWVDVERYGKAMDSHQPKMRRCQSRDSKRGRNELREVVVMPAPTDCPILAQWAGVKTIGVIYRSREINGKIEESSETFISSLEPKVRDLSKRIREHCEIENQQHYILDVTFSEDATFVVSVSDVPGITPRSNDLSHIFPASNMRLPCAVPLLIQGHSA
ncbi:MAG: ISAs1 family transposase [Planctomycetaceae bacterium]|jgi:predicted transposase YbfD/YdcC|nr:ISAs1 family transposase [Planctomycetaceae bacterium]MCE2813501.1 ISAs1 family transposase [Planctomycetaceae bacterium]